MSNIHDVDGVFGGWVAMMSPQFLEDLLGGKVTSRKN